MTRLSESLWHHVWLEACRPYRGVGRLAYHFARGKLQHDPMFRTLLECGGLQADTRVLDLGCGQGLIAAVLHAVTCVHQSGLWGADLPPAPLRCAYQGIDLMPAAVARATAALSSLPSAPQFDCADVISARLPASDLILLLDVLHYIDLPAQQLLLQHVRQALAPHGRLLIRVGDPAHPRRHAFSQWVDRWVVRARGDKARPHFARPLSSWVAMLNNLGFAVDTQPLSQGTPFSNVLLVAQVPTLAKCVIEDVV